MQIKTQKMCECQNINFNKNALIFLSSNYIVEKKNEKFDN